MSNFSTSSDSNPLIPPLPAHGRHPTHNRSCPDMTSPIRFATASLLAASLAFGLAACTPIDNDAKQEDKADAAAGGHDITTDRTRVLQGKRVLVRVDLGGRRISKNKNKKTD